MRSQSSKPKKTNSRSSYKLRILYSSLTAVSLTLGCAGEPPPRDVSSLKSNLSSDASGGLLAKENPNFSGDTKSQIRKYQQLIADRNEELNFLRNSEDKLSKMILLQSARGCMLEKNIDSLEIIIGGGKQPDRDHGTRDNKRSSEGSPDDIVIDFGNTMTVSVNGNGLFDRKNHSTGALSSRKVADIQKIKFLKDGIKYSNKRVCERSGGFLGIGASEKCRYEVTEENIWFLNEVKIKVNGVLIYDKGGINKNFDGGRSEWEDNNIKENEAYIEMLTKVDCG